MFYVYEALIKLEPVLGLRIFAIKKKHKKILKIRPVFITFLQRSKKAINWLIYSFLNRIEVSFILKFVNELYSINFVHISKGLKKKKKIL